MTLWICNSCGCTERLNILPDACSLCGGTLETQDGRSTAALHEHAGYDQAHYEAMEVAMGETSDPAEIIWLWHEGNPLTTAQQAVLDDMLHQNRMGLMAAAYADFSEAA